VIETSSEERICSDYGGQITTAVGMDWQDPSDREHGWVGTCRPCNMATPNEDHTFGIDGAANLIRVDAFMFDDDLA
jgi:hypothetical protein